MIRCSNKRYLVKRITDGDYADVRHTADGGLQIVWVKDVGDAYVTIERTRAKQIAALLDLAAYPNFGKIIIEAAK